MVLPRWLRYHPFVQYELNGLISAAERLTIENPEAELREETLREARGQPERRRIPWDAIPPRIATYFSGQDPLIDAVPEPISEDPPIYVPNLIEGSRQVSVLNWLSFKCYQKL